MAITQIKDERAAALGEDQQILIHAAGKAIILCKSQGQYFAIENRCTHDHEQLLGGRIQKCSIVCPVHAARFSLKTGMPYGPPAFEPIATFPVSVSGDVIEIDLAPR